MIKFIVVIMIFFIFNSVYMLNERHDKEFIPRMLLWVFSTLAVGGVLLFLIYKGVLV